MKKSTLIAALLLIFASCAKERITEAPKTGEGRLVVFSAEFVNDNSKTSLSEGGKVEWKENDPVSIFDGNTPVTATAANSGESTQFSAVLSNAAPWYAIYPADASATISGDAITTTIPCETACTSNTFADLSNVSIAMNSGMDNKLNFKNTMSFLKFKLKNDGVCRVSLKGNSEEQISGKVSIAYNSGDPVVTPKPEAVKTASIIPADGETQLVKDDWLYLGFAPTTFSNGFTVTITDVFGEEYKINHAASFTAVRSKIYNVGTLDGDITIDEEITFADDDVKNAIVAAFGSDGKITKLQAAAVTLDQMTAFTWPDKSLVNSFDELIYFIGLYDSGAGSYYVPASFFENCTNLTSVTFPANATEISSNTCKSCSSLQQVRFPSTLLEIKSSAFEECSSLAELDFPDGLTTVGSKAFYFKTVNNTVITSLNIPNITSIGDYAFYGFRAVTKAVLPSTVKELGQQAFWRLDKATCIGPEGTPEGTLQLPTPTGSVNDIKGYTFCDEFLVNTLRIPEGYETIASNAFRAFGRDAEGTVSGYLPASLTSLSANALSSSGFNYVVFAGTTPPTLTGNPFASAAHFTDGTLKIYVPDSALSDYKNSTTWKTYGLDAYVYSINDRPPLAGHIEVKGRIVDVRPLRVPNLSGVAEEDKWKYGLYPQKDEMYVNEDMVNLPFEASSYAICLHESRGPQWVKVLDDGIAPIVASGASTLSGWTSMGKTFTVSGQKYYLYTKSEYTKDEWVEIPEAGTVSAIAFGQSIVVRNTPDYTPNEATAGITTIALSGGSSIRDRSIGNAAIAIAPNGDYVAVCTGAQDLNICLYRSTDKGATWNYEPDSFKSATNLIYKYPSLFVFDGNLYMMGVGDNREGIRICKSTDNGKTWTIADSSTTGIVLNETSKYYYSGPGTAIVTSNGRLYAAWEYYESETSKTPFVMSCPTSKDIMDATNWSKTNTFDAGSCGNCWEGNMVATPAGQVFNYTRQDMTNTSNTAKRFLVTSNTNLQDVGQLNMPGGGKKFKLLYDSVSTKYWAITNPHTYTSYPIHDGIYSVTGCTPPFQRNKLSLICSSDMVNWISPVPQLFYHSDCYFHGFQYVDFVIDGDDLACVMVLAEPEERGLPLKQTEANKFCFFKVKDFRDQ